ncbi:uncharacterized protein LOC142817616 [Rhipicephalus microplus]|uniref:uncharacterized protein LOC142817616 n=1 Tax=Rhipicephalus microplus TaxID=6941 RepID=UPI003F6AC5CC
MNGELLSVTTTGSLHLLRPTHVNGPFVNFKLALSVQRICSCVISIKRGTLLPISVLSDSMDYTWIIFVRGLPAHCLQHLGPLHHKSQRNLGHGFHLAAAVAVGGTLTYTHFFVPAVRGLASEGLEDSGHTPALPVQTRFPRAALCATQIACPSSSVSLGPWCRPLMVMCAIGRCPEASTGHVLISKLCCNPPRQTFLPIIDPQAHFIRQSVIKLLHAN